MSRKAVILLAISIAGFLVLCAAAWLGFSGLAAKDDLQSAAGALSRAKTAISKGDVAGAKEAAAEAALNTGSARSETSDLVWQAAGAIPLLGATPRTVTLTAQAADEVASGAIPRLVAAAESFQLDKLRQPDGSVDLSLIKQAAAQVFLAKESLDHATATLASAPDSYVIGTVTDARDQLKDQLDSVSSATGTAARLLAVMPKLLGEDRPQRYFIAFQSPVEIRGTGGFLGTYGIMTVDRGRLTVDRVATDSDLQNFPAPILDLGPEYRQIYGNEPRFWVNMNMSPNFPFAGEQWVKAWQLQTGETLDGVLGINVAALQYLSDATGPVTSAKGAPIPADQLVEYLTNGIYLDFPDPEGPVNEARKQFQAQVGTDLLKRVLSFEGDTATLIADLQKSVSGRHLQMWSADPAIQRTLATTPLAGATSTAEQPYLQLVLNNSGGNKMDYYLQRDVKYSGGTCEGGRRKSTVDVTLTNTIPAQGDLPPLLTMRTDRDGDAIRAPTRSNETLAYLHMTPGSGVLKATLNGRQIGVYSGTELGHPVVYFEIELPAGVPMSLHLDVTEPILPGSPMVPVQPMVQPQRTQIDWSECSSNRP